MKKPKLSKRQQRKLEHKRYYRIARAFWTATSFDATASVWARTGLAYDLMYYTHDHWPFELLLRDDAIDAIKSLALSPALPRRKRWPFLLAGASSDWLRVSYLVHQFIRSGVEVADRVARDVAF